MGTKTQGHAVSGNLHERVRRYLLDNGNESSAAVTAALSDDHNVDGGGCVDDVDALVKDSDLDGFLSGHGGGKKRARDESVDPQSSHHLLITTPSAPPPVGLVAAIDAISLDQSLRNQVCISMPRRMHNHRACDRLCVCPIFSHHPVADGDAMAAREPVGNLLVENPCVMFYSEVLDPALARDLSRISAHIALDEDDEFGEGGRMKLPDPHVAADVVQASDWSDASMRDLRSRRHSLSQHDRQKLHPRRKLLGLELPSEERITSLSDEQIHAYVQSILSLHVGPHVKFVDRRYLTFEYKRQTMTNPLDVTTGAEGPDAKSGESNERPSAVFVALGGNVVQDLDAVREQIRAKEAHLRFCGVVDNVEDYTTLVVVAFIVDPVFFSKVMSGENAEGSASSVVAAETSHEPNHSHLTSSTGSEARAVLQTPPASVHVPFGASVMLPCDPHDPHLTLLGDAPRRWFTTNTVGVSESHRVSPFRSDFCASRDHFEAALTLKHLHEAFETVLVERIVGIARCRLERLPLSKLYDARVKRIHADCVASNVKMSEFVERVWSLQRSSETFRELFMPAASVAIGFERDVYDEIVERTKNQLDRGPAPLQKHELLLPQVPSERAVVGCLQSLVSLWSRPKRRQHGTNTQQEDLQQNDQANPRTGGFPVSRLANLMIAALISPGEVDKLMVQIATDVSLVPDLRFEWFQRTCEHRSDAEWNCHPDDAFGASDQFVANRHNDVDVYSDIDDDDDGDANGVDNAAPVLVAAYQQVKLWNKRLNTES
jgi:hypothetical protein